MRLYLLLITVFCFTASQAQTNAKRALIVAIGDYPSNTDWSDISSINDIPIIKEALTRQGFTDFSIIQNEGATKEGIMNALNNLASSCVKGDVVAVHFSSHGQQIEDNNGDELDGLDEAIVCYGAPAYYIKDYKGEKHLRDEELGHKLDSIRSIIGKNGDLIVFMDACHSGTGTRGTEKVRGGIGPLISPNSSLSSSSGGDESLSMFEQSSASRGESNMSPMVVISASRAEEVNYEYNGYGSLSFAVRKSMENLQSNITYRSYFAHLLKEMNVVASRQTPALEGDIDRKMFAGEVVQQEPYYSLKNLDGDWAAMDGGQLVGLNKGSILSIYPAGTQKRNSSDILTKGKVVNSDQFSVNLQLDKSLAGKANEYWAFMEQQSFGESKVHICVCTENKKLNKSISKALENDDLIVVDESKPAFNLVGDQNSLMLQKVSDGSTYKENIAYTEDLIELKETLKAYVQSDFVRNLNISHPDYDIRLDLVPVTIVNNRVVDTPDINKYMKDGLMQFSTTDRAMIRITNNGSFAVYFNVVDIQPDGIINPVVPNPRKNEDPKDFKIEAGKSYIIRNKALRFAPPFGKETYKVFASLEPINLSPIILSRGSTTRSLNSKLEQLFQDSYSMSRGTPVGDLDSGTEACTFDYIFKIVEKNNN